MKIRVAYRLFFTACLMLALGLSAAELRAQDSLRISGIIVGKGGEALDNVAISIEGVYAAPVITDSAGYFEMVSPSGDVWMTINPVEGYKSKRIYLNKREELKIILTPIDMASGYDLEADLFGAEPNRDFVASHQAPEPEVVFHLPNQSVDQSFQGQVSGLLATLQSGMPGAGTTSYLRGIKSMFTNNQPMYIVDGLPLETPGLFQSKLYGYEHNPLFSLDPMDITNITILKDYSESAVHGMRASNGVVLIETLKPTEVRTTIDFAFRSGFTQKNELIPQLDAGQYKTLANEVLMSSSMYEEEYREIYFPLYSTPADPEHYKYSNNTNWQEEIYQNALMNDFYLRVRGGDEISKYGLSISYLKHNGIIKNTDASRFNVRFAGAFNVIKWLRLNVTTNLVTSQANLRESALASQTSPVLTGLFKSPLLLPYQFDEDGNQLQTLEEVNSLGTSNPVSVIDMFEGRNRNYRFLTSFKAEVDILKDRLTFTSLLGINLNSMNENVFMPNTGMELYYDDEVYNAAKSLKNYLYATFLDNYLVYRQEFRNKHRLTASTGMRVYKNTFEVDWGVAKNAHERDEYKQLQNGVTYLREMGGESAKWNRLAFYANGSYSFRNKYFLDATVVTEYSSRTGSNSQDVVMLGDQPFGLFYSFGGAWRLSSESILKDQAWLENLKLRVSYGLVGNDDIGNLTSLDYLTVVHYRETSGMVPGIITDQSVRFESNTQLNAGLDLSLLGNRVSLTADIFDSRTSNLLVFEPQPSYTGFSVIPINNGEISNRGWELGLSSRIVHGDRFKWDLHVNVAGFTNRVEAIKDGAVVTPFVGGEFISKVDEPVLSFYGYQYEGVYATAEEAEADGFVTERGTPFGAGDARFADLSGPEGRPDSVIDLYDRTLIGSPVPDFYGGITNTLSFGRWSLSASLQFVLGQEVFNFVRSRNEAMSGLANQSSKTLERWTQEGQITEVPRASFEDPTGNASFSSRWIEDGSYIRLKHLTLSYTIPDKVLMLRNLEIFVTASNLFTWNRYLGYDPEFSYSYFTMEQGIDYGTMPSTRKFMAGIKFGL